MQLDGEEMCTGPTIKYPDTEKSEQCNSGTSACSIKEAQGLQNKTKPEFETAYFSHDRNFND